MLVVHQVVRLMMSRMMLAVGQMVVVHQVVRLMMSRMMLAVGQMVVCQMDEAPHDPMVPRDEAPDDPMVEIVRDGRDWCFDLQDLLRVLVVEVWNLSTA